MQPSTNNNNSVTVDSFRRNSTAAVNRKTANSNNKPDSSNNSDNKINTVVNDTSKQNPSKKKNQSSFFASETGQRLQLYATYLFYSVIGVMIVVFYLLITRLGLFPTVLPPPTSFTAPLLPESALEVIASLPIPAGNIAVSEKGRIFFTFHPEYQNDPDYPVNIAELNNQVDTFYASSSDKYSLYRPFPALNYQKAKIVSVLSLRIDHLDRLWLLDFAQHGTHAKQAPQLLCFQLLLDAAQSQTYTTSYDSNTNSNNDVTSNTNFNSNSNSNQHNNMLKVLEETPVLTFTFPASVAGFGSFLNDFAVDRDGHTLYIVDTSLLAQTPALIIFDSVCRCSFRLLQSHPSMMGVSLSFTTPSVVNNNNAVNSNYKNVSHRVGGFAAGGQLVGLKIHADSIALAYHQPLLTHNNMNMNNILHNNDIHNHNHDNNVLQNVGLTPAALKKRAKVLQATLHKQRLLTSAKNSVHGNNNNNANNNDNNNNANNNRDMAEQELALEISSERRLYFGALTGSDLWVVTDIRSVVRDAFLKFNFHVNTSISSYHSSTFTSSRVEDPHRHTRYRQMLRYLQQTMPTHVKRISRSKPVTDGLSVTSVPLHNNHNHNNYFTSTPTTNTNNNNHNGNSNSVIIVATNVHTSSISIAATHTTQPFLATSFLPLVSSPQLLQWPDGLSFGGDGSLYITASHLQEKLGTPIISKSTIGNNDHHASSSNINKYNNHKTAAKKKAFHILRISGKQLASVSLTGQSDFSGGTKNNNNNNKIQWFAPVSAGH